MNKFYKLSLAKRFFVAVIVFLFTCFLIRPNTSYYYIKESLSYSKQFLLGITSSLDKNDYVDILIDKNAEKKLSKYLEKNPVKKKWIDIKILIEGKYWDAKIKFHGTHKNHYKNKKYSYSIKLSKSGPYINNSRRFKLIKSEEAKEVLALNNLGVQSDLISVAGSFKILKINNKKIGSYYFVEAIEKEFLERKFGITNYVTISNVNDWSRKEGLPHVSPLNMFPGHIEKSDDFNHGFALNEFENFVKNIKENNLHSILPYIDQKYMAKFLGLIALFNDSHYIAGDNLKFIYDFSRGKFYPIFRPEYRGSIMSKEFSSEFVANFNGLVFESLKGKYETSLWNDFFKILISNNSIRNQRDTFLYNLFLKKNKISHQLDSTFTSINHIQYSVYKL